MQKTFHHAGHAAFLDIVFPNLQQRHLAPLEQTALAFVCPDAFGQTVDEETLHFDRPGHRFAVPCGHRPGARSPERDVEDVDALLAPVRFRRQQPLAIEEHAVAEEFAHHEQLQRRDPEQAVFAHLLHDEHAPVLGQGDGIARAARLGFLAARADRSASDGALGVVFAHPAFAAALRADERDVSLPLEALPMQAAAQLPARVVDEGDHDSSHELNRGVWARCVDGESQRHSIAVLLPLVVVDLVSIFQSSYSSA